MRTQADEIQLILAQKGAAAIRDMKIWTNAYRPFIMGGDCHGPIGTTVPVMGPFDGGKDFKLFLALSPKNIVHVIDAVTGAFVGTSLEEVRKDIEEGDMDFMKKQLADALKRAEVVHCMSPAEFWSHFREER